MELRHLRYFAAVAEELHFGRAAARLGIAQPPLSRQIHDLELELGFALFERSRPRVGLTAAWRVFYEHARSLLADLDAAVRDARRTSLGEGGCVSVGYPSSLAYTGLTELLRNFRARFPGVDVALSELAPAAIVDALKSGQIDVGFVRGPLEEPLLAVEIVRRETLLLAMPKDHALAKKKRVTLRAVAGQPFIFFPRERSPAFFDLLMSLCRDAGFQPRIAQEAPQNDVLSLVAAGFGLSIVPASLRETGRKDVVFCPIVGAPTTELLITWRSGDVSPASQRFVELVRRLGVHRARSAK